MSVTYPSTMAMPSVDESVSTPVVEAAPAPKPSKLKTTLSGIGNAFAMLRNGKSITGLIIMSLFLLVALFAPQIARFDPMIGDWFALRSAPTATHWLGTDNLGRDIFSQLVWGTRTAMQVGIVAAVLATFMAAFIGILSGFLSGWAAEALSAFTNVFLIFPAMALIIIVASMLTNPSLVLLAAVQAMLAWAGGARIMRAQTLSLRNREFIQAARANGEPIWRIICVEMLPNLMALIAGTFSASFMGGVVGITSLTFLGILPITTPNWGSVLNFAQAGGAFTAGMWWWYIPAGILLALMGTALSLIQFGIDEFVNPRLRSAGERRRALKKRGIKLKDGTTQIVDLSENPDLIVSEA